MDGRNPLRPPVASSPHPVAVGRWPARGHRAERTAAGAGKLERVRRMPPDLVKQLRAARRFELHADGLHRQRDAITATGSMMLAVVEAGWSRTEIAAALGMNHQTVAKRVATARQLYGDARPGLLVAEAPARTAPHPLAVLRQPVSEREWLSQTEAAKFAGRSAFTIRDWRRGGLLPNTQRPTTGTYLYLRADLRRVLRGPLYKNRGVDHQAVRAEIDAAPV